MCLVSPGCSAQWSAAPTGCWDRRGARAVVEGRLRGRPGVQHGQLRRSLRDATAAAPAVPEPHHLPGPELEGRVQHDGELRHQHQLAVLLRRAHDVVPSQTAGLAVQNFVSAAVGMAGWRRWSAASPVAAPGDSATSGPTWCASRPHPAAAGPRGRGDPEPQGAIQTFSTRSRTRCSRAHVERGLRAGRPRSRSTAGADASQVAIKELGTNGGGYNNANSAPPFENPTGLTNFVEMLLILLIPSALANTFRVMVGSPPPRLVPVRHDDGAARDRPGHAAVRRAARFAGAATGVHLMSVAGLTGGNMTDKEPASGSPTRRSGRRPRPTCPTARSTAARIA